MKAKIFFLNESQNECCKSIAKMLREHIYRDIDIERLGIGEYKIDDFRKSNDYIYLKSYFYLLKRCMTNSLAIVEGFMKEDFNVILKVDNSSLWYYIDTGYSSLMNDESWLEIHYQELNSIFPAIAIMDQMVILPHNIGDAFSRHSGENNDFFWFPRPLDLDGVLLVDFEDKKSVENAIQQVGLRIKSRIGKLSARHMMVRGIKKPDFKELSKLIKVDQEFLEEINLDEIACKKVKFTVVVISEPVKVNKISPITIEIRYESEIPLGRVQVKVKAPQSALIHTVSETLDFSTSEPKTKRIEFDLSPEIVPYCPLSVLFELYEKDEELTPFPVFTTVDVVP